ncbi:MAG: imelysin family protein [Aureispira sp.]|nr:imelysin family protein [Aureispira sp.]
MRYIVLVILLLSTVACKKKAEFDKEQMFKDIATNTILPAHLGLEAKANTLLLKVEAFVQNPNSIALSEAQTAWKVAMSIWAFCEAYNLGPVKERYLTWIIDRTPTNPTAIETIIADSAQLIDSSFVAEQSSYNKGFPAIEYLLFNTDNSKILSQYTNLNNVDRRKQYLTEVSSNLALQCSNLYNIWAPDGENYSATFQSSLGNDLQGAISMLSNSMINLTQEIARKKIGKPLGKEANDGLVHPEFIESPYANYSFDIILGNLEGILLAFTTMGSGFDDYLNHLTENEDLSQKIITKIENARVKIVEINATLKTALANQTTKVEELYTEVRDLLILLNVDMANSFMVTVLPSDSDGD